jgi:hypothetical protein
MPTFSVTNLSDFNLGAGSAAIGIGVDLQRLSAIPRGVDWHSNPAIADAPAKARINMVLAS